METQSEEEFILILVDEFQRILDLGSDFFLKRSFQNICGVDLEPVKAIE
mgnify:CR=1 FL=1